MDKTTIQISGETLERLKMLKQFQESYDIVLNKLIDEYDEDTLYPEEIEEIQEALENVKQGKVKPVEQVAKELGVKLQ